MPQTNIKYETFIVLKDEINDSYEIQLSYKEARLFELLYNNRNKIVSFKDLLFTLRTTRGSLKLIKHKLQIGLNDPEIIIEPIYAVGYRLIIPESFNIVVKDIKK